LSTSFQQEFLRKKSKKRSRSAAITECPQKEGVVIRARINTPRKPNSARRPVVKAKLSNSKFVVSHIPGIGHNLRAHSHVLIRGGGCRDLPGVRHTCIRGVLDFLGIKSKSRRRSIYGVKRPQDKVKKLRKKFRVLFNQ